MNKDDFKRFSDIELVAGNMYGEARFVELATTTGGLPLEEIREYLAVSMVIMNRVKSPRWGKTIKDVIFEKAQFSWLNEGDPSMDAVWKFLTTWQPDKTFRRMMMYAKYVVEGRMLDLSHGANHYIAEWAMLEKAGTNHWSQRCIITYPIGGHIFMTDGEP